MPRSQSPTTILDDVLYLNLDDEIEEPALRNLAQCIREISPTIKRASQRCGAGTATAALIVIAVNMAIDQGDPARLADALRLHAEILDVEAQLGTIAGTA